jgi:hypothetical protein
MQTASPSGHRRRPGGARHSCSARGGKWTAVQVSRLLEVAAIPFFDASAAVAA